MMLCLIGAGVGRTGTMSLKAALSAGGPRYHMAEALERPEHVPLWRAAAAGDEPGWHELLGGRCGGGRWPGRRVLARAERGLSRCRRAPVAARRGLLVAQRARHDLSGIAPSAGMNGAPWSMRCRPIASPPRPRTAEAVHRRFRAGQRARARSDSRPSAARVARAADGRAPLRAALGAPVPDEPFPCANTTVLFPRHTRGREWLSVRRDPCGARSSKKGFLSAFATMWPGIRAFGCWPQPALRSPVCTCRTFSAAPVMCVHYGLLGNFARVVPPLAVVVIMSAARAGKRSKTPVVAFADAGGFVIPMTDGRDVDGRATSCTPRGRARTPGRRHALHNPRVVDGKTAAPHLAACSRRPRCGPTFRGFVLLDQKKPRSTHSPRPDCLPEWDMENARITGCRMGLESNAVQGNGGRRRGRRAPQALAGFDDTNGVAAERAAAGVEEIPGEGGVGIAGDGQRMVLIVAFASSAS